MLSNNPAEPQASLSSVADTGTALPDPRSTIEAASGGTGSTGDPGATDNKPPGVSDYELFI